MSGLTLVATCARGLEGILAAELQGLGLSATDEHPGGVTVGGAGWPDVWRANWRLRSANRVLVELSRWPAPDREKLYAGVRSTLRRLVANRDPLGRLFDPRNTLAIAATSLVSRMRDTRLVALVTKDAVVDTQREVFGSRSDIDRDRPDLPLRMRLHHDEATLLLDTSGEPLDHRGYRGATSAASAREQLVAAAILASGWDGQGPVVDPMCGAGTFLAEAASIALGWSPARLRKRFAFEGFTGFEPAAFDAIRREAIPAPGPDVRLFGVDSDPLAIDAARVSLQRAGLGGRATLHVGDGFAIEPPPGPPGLVCINPPWGERLAESEDLWRRLGDLLKQRFKGWRAVLLAGDARMGAGLGLRARKYPVRAGAAELRILVVELY